MMALRYLELKALGCEKTYPRFCGHEDRYTTLAMATRLNEGRAGYNVIICMI